MKYKLYKLTFPNGKSYIGMTSQDIKRRCRETAYKNQPIMADAIKQFGWDKIKIDIIMDELSKENAEKEEYNMIKFYKTNQIKNGYNIANGGHDEKSFSTETKHKISKAHKGVKFSEERKSKISNSLKGRKLTDEHKKKIGIKSKGRKPRQGAKLTDETKIKISTALIGNKNWYGKKHTEKAKEKIRQSKLGKSYKDIPVMQYDKNINFIKEYKSMKEAADINNYNSGNICQCCKGKLKTYKGFIWRYKDTK